MKTPRAALLGLLLIAPAFRAAAQNAPKSRDMDMLFLDMSKVNLGTISGDVCTIAEQCQLSQDHPAVDRVVIHHKDAGATTSGLSRRPGLKHARRPLREA